MEDIIKIILLAIVQGITEFLPISSSGHLVITKHFLDLRGGGATLEIILHSGTLVSIIIYYRYRLVEIIKKLAEKDPTEWRYLKFIILAIIPISFIGLIYADDIESFFCNTLSTSIMLIFTGIFLIFSNFFKFNNLRLSNTSSLIIGFGQMLALLPGISRSGMTIGIARLFGIDSKKAAEFSFLIAVPVLFGVLIHFILNGASNDHYSFFELFLGFIISAVVGFLALSWLVSILSKGRFWYFGIYCIVVGFICLLILS